jgi:L-ascorbate metabolism protein UlaG (beta-lactamase superfamily)
VIPDIVTMNIAHSTHYTLFPDPRIPHVLHGWSDEPGGRAEHFLTVGDVLVRNVTTDIRSYGGVQEDRNSIFIFEVAGLCLGHLGHLHQPLSDAQVAEIGRLDVVFVPIDGSYTMDQATMMDVVSRLRASIAIPMHWFSRYSLETFVARTAQDGLTVEMAEGPTIRVSLNTLPDEPTLMVLPREQPF